MRALTKDELGQLAGGIKNYGETEESRNFILGAGIGIIFSTIILETELFSLGSLVAAMIGGALYAALIDEKK